MALTTLLQKIKTAPDSVEFNEVIEQIAESYHYTPSRFTNGIGDDQVISKAGSNEGSCKIFAFAQLNDLSESETLACFGKYYRDDVLGNPEGSDHGNIRSFMRYGWAGIQFEQAPLKAK